MENNDEILDEKRDENRRKNAPTITSRSHPRQQEKNQVIIFIIFRGLVVWRATENKKKSLKELKKK